MGEERLKQRQGQWDALDQKIRVLMDKHDAKGDIYLEDETWFPEYERLQDQADALLSEIDALEELESRAACGDNEPVTRGVEVTLPQVYWDRIDRLLEADPDTQDIQTLLTALLDHVQQGVYRSGAWERNWLGSLFDKQVIEKAALWEEDPLWPVKK